MSCCCHKPDPEPPSGVHEKSGCCGTKPAEAGGCCGNSHRKYKPDWILHGSLVVIIAALAFHFFPGSPNERFPRLAEFSHGVWMLLRQMAWGVALGILAVGILSRVPREVIAGILGRGGTFAGIARATAAGLLLDLCNHGILLVAAQLYKKGASIGQVVAFLVASPWNSFSVTFVLIALIGLPWTLAIVALSLVVALITGRVFDFLVSRGTLPRNPNSAENAAPLSGGQVLSYLKNHVSFSPAKIPGIVFDGLRGSRMIVRWLLFGAVLAALVQAFVPEEIFREWFGPTVAGLFLTLLAATVIEVCSEGSVPLAAQLFTRAGAPGNGFVFLMAGASTDLTEILVLREATRSWKIPLALPLVTVPQIVLLGWLLNP